MAIDLEEVRVADASGAQFQELLVFRGIYGRSRVRPHADIVLVLIQVLEVEVPPSIQLLNMFACPALLWRLGLRLGCFWWRSSFSRRWFGRQLLLNSRLLLLFSYLFILLLDLISVFDFVHFTIRLRL